MGITEGFVPKRYEQAPGGIGSGGQHDPFVVGPRGPIPQGMVRAHLSTGDGKEVIVQGPPELMQRVTDAFSGRTPTGKTTPPRAEPTAQQPPPQPVRTETAPVTPPSPTRQPRPTRTPQSGQIAPASTQPRVPVTPGGQPIVEEIDDEFVQERMPPGQPSTRRSWFGPTRDRIIEIRDRRGNALAAGLLGLLLGAGAVGLAWWISSNTPPDTTITRFRIPVGQCENVPGNSIAIGYFMSVDGITYNTEKDPSQGVVVALNSPARVCTDPDDQQPTLIETVGDGQQSLYTHYAQDIEKVQAEGCINNGGCRRVITVVK